MKTPKNATQDSIDLIAKLTACATDFENDDATQPTYNAHVCKLCGHVMFSVHVHTGTASARITCPAPKCGGESWSMFYRLTPDVIPDDGKNSSWPDVANEWYRPTLQEMMDAASSREYLNHVINNGLLMRPRTSLPMLRHDGSFVNDDGIKVESPTELQGLKELGALQKQSASAQQTKRISTHTTRQEFERLKRDDSAAKNKKRKQARASKRRNRKS
jgi:hypothetical protein